MTTMEESSSSTSSEEVETVPHLLQTLRNSNSKDEIVETIEELRSISRGDDAGKEQIGAEGGIEVILELLQSNDLDIQQNAAKLLRSISVNEKNQEKIAQAGGIPLLVQMLSCKDDPTLKLACTATLWNLSVNDLNKQKIADDGGIPVLIRVLKSNDPKLQNEAVGALRNLSFLEENKKIIGREGAIPVLVSLLRSSNERIQRNSALTLRNLIANNEKNMRRIEREGGVELLMKVLTEHNLNDISNIVATNLLKQLHFEDTVNWEDITLIRKIGEGKYGDVYKALYHGFPVACKIIKKELQESDAESTLEELKLMKRLKHPNVVMLMGACLNPLNQVVIVTEYLSRGNLKDCLTDIKSLPLRLKIGSDIANGLAWLHAHNIIHRDLKLANLLVADDWTVKISDFGLSLHLTKDLVCRGFKGNVKYSPPEILRARYDKSISVYPYSEKTDVYSFGLMLWELISLQPLFPTIKGKEELTQYVLAGYRPPIDPEWPESLKELLQLCWHQDPDKRPYFPTILKKYDQVIIDLMCPDMAARRICKRLWRGKYIQKTTKVFYSDFERIFTESLKIDFTKVKRTHVKAFTTVLCDSFDDTITFERFARVVNWFGPLQPVDEFFGRIKELLSKSYFHGFVNAAKAEALVKSTWNQISGAKVSCYLYRFSATELGGFVLTYIDKNGNIYHKKIQRTPRGFRLDDLRIEQPTFVRLHKACKTALKLRKHVPDSPYVGLFKKL